MIKVLFISDKNKGSRQAKSSSSKTYRDDDDFFLDTGEPSNWNDKPKSRGPQPPPHLKGREIGNTYTIYIFICVLLDYIITYILFQACGMHVDKQVKEKMKKCLI